LLGGVELCDSIVKNLTRGSGVANAMDGRNTLTLKLRQPKKKISAHKK
jgi:hypothetical protein